MLDSTKFKDFVRIQIYKIPSKVLTFQIFRGDHPTSFMEVINSLDPFFTSFHSTSSASPPSSWKNLKTPVRKLPRIGIGSLGITKSSAAVLNDWRLEVLTAFELNFEAFLELRFSSDFPKLASLNSSLMRKRSSVRNMLQLLDVQIFFHRGNCS